MNIKEIKAALTALNEELKNLKIKGEISIMGGAAMCLAYKARESTQDIDALMAPSELIQKAAFNVSETLQLNNNFWINDAVKTFNSDHAQFSKSDLSQSNLTVFVATPEYMFAMKALAARSGTNDETDLVFLKKMLNLKNIENALLIINQFYPKQKLSIESQLLLKDLFEDS